MTAAHALVGVLGASGGLGASTLALALAARAASDGLGPTAVVDLHLHGGGLDVSAGVEHRAGVRWGDLAGARGVLDGHRLLAELPAVGQARVLAPGPHRGSAARPVVREAVRALCAAATLTVLDLPRDPDPELVAECGGLVLLCGLSARHLADAAAARVAVLPAGGQTRLVVRSRHRGDPLVPRLAAAAAEHLGLELAGVLREDPAVRTEGERGLVPGRRRRCGLGRLCASLLGSDLLVPQRLPAGVGT